MDNREEKQKKQEKERVRTTVSKKKVLEELQRSLGIVSIACRKCGITRKSYYRWMREDEEFKSAVEEIYESRGDFVEGKLLENIRSGDTTSIIFYCKTKLKERGYVERKEQEVSVESKQPINITIERDPRCKDSTE